MIKKYLDFINESIELVLESDVVYSDKMRLALSKIENPIAKKLLEIENKDYPVKTNYFDIPPGINDKVSFIPDKKAQEILKDTKEMVRYVGTAGWLKHKEVNLGIFSKLGYTYEEGSEPHSPSSSDIGEVISKVTSETTGNVYAWVKFKNNNNEDLGQGVYNYQKLRPIDENSKLVWSKNRQDVKIGKAMKAILDIVEFKFTAAELEVFVNQFKSTIDKLNDKFSHFKLVEGEEIGGWYDYRKYSEKKGTLGSSCMASAPRRYFSIYMENSNVCKLLILKSQEDENKITGRALLWTLNSGEQFLDRIYTINDSDVELFREYAKESGWYSKYHNNSSVSVHAINPKTGDIDTSLIGNISINRGEYDGYPYLDTFKYFNPHSGTLSVDKESDSYTLESTGGDYIRCEYCGGSGTTTCGDCDGDGDFICRNCDGSGNEECDECGGRGEHTCSICDGEGEIEGDEGEKVECGECSGSGKISCGYCDGNGEKTCHQCDGDGRTECENCGGHGSYDCPECN
jgi:hypothetical protein